MSITEIAAQSASRISEGFPFIIKPPVKLIAYLYTLFIALIMSFLQLLQNRSEDPFFKLRSELETRWYSQSSFMALNRLRSIYSILKKNEELVILGRLKILSYGRFHMIHYQMVTDLIFNWEFIHRNWFEAGRVCDHALSTAARISGFADSTDSWIIKKAETLHHLEGNISAQKFLLKHLDPERADCPVKSYLHKLRKVS